MKIFYKINHFLLSQSGWVYLVIFCLAYLAFGIIQAYPTFPDPDSFYHAKMALMLRDHGVSTEFPHLAFTVLRFSFADHHLLYHLLLIPFVSFFSPLLGLKIATLILASLTIVFFYWLLRQLNVRTAFWYAAFLLTINPFVFRLNLAKAQALVLIFLFIFLFLMFRRYYLALMAIAFAYTWLYGGWPLIIVLVAIYLVTIIFFPLNHKKLVFKVNLGNGLKQTLPLVLVIGSGTILGLFFSPYFPKNLSFLWEQFFKIGVINFQQVIGVGGEWYPYRFLDLLFDAAPLFVLLLFALGVFIYTGRKNSPLSLVTLLFTIFFLLLTLKSRRHVEYFAPFAVMFSALALNASTAAKKVVGLVKSSKILIGLTLILCCMIGAIFGRDFYRVKQSYQQGINFDKFAAASQWLIKNSAPQSIVFHSDWDEFPILFFNNDKNYYIVGLDPTFMYEHNKQLHQVWVKITTGEKVDNLYQVIKDVFNADYVFVDAVENKAFDKNLSDNIYFQKVYGDKEANIYQVTR